MKEGSAIKVAVIVVNWNCGALTKVAIEPYLNITTDALFIEVIVVDNDSKDESVEILRRLPIRLIENKTNAGFGHACNQGFELAKDADYLLLLNPDTISEINTLSGLIAYLETHPTCAVTGPRQLNESGMVLRSCGRFPNFKTALWEVLSFSKLFPRLFTPAPIMLEWNHANSRQVDHIMGSYMLIRKSVLNQVGFMDKDYFVYWEDIDLSRRIHLAGYDSYYHAGYTITHAGGASGDKATAKRLFYSISARRIYWKKHLNKVAFSILFFLSFTAEPILRIFQALLKRRLQEIREITAAYRMYFRKD